MRVRIEWGLAAVCLAVAACGGGVTPSDAGDGSTGGDGSMGDGSSGDGSSGDGGSGDGGSGDGGSGDGGGIDMDFDMGPIDAGPCTGPAACYGGAAATRGVGACMDGVQQCIAGALGICMGEVQPSTESCNGVDDDCNGTADDGLGTISCGIGACATTAAACTGGVPGTCTPLAATTETCDGIDNNCNGAIDETCSCVHVSRATGSDTTGDGSAVLPFRTINHAIAAAGTGTLPNIVCVGAGAVCATATYDEAVVMRDGVGVYGGYQEVGASWPRVAACITQIRDQDARGVYFDASVSSPTALDGFTIAGHDDAANAAVTVDGSTGAIVTNDIVNGGSGTTSYGVDVLNGATPILSLDQINGGTGSTTAIGVHSLGSAPIVQNNCQTTDASGRCMTGCGGTNVKFIRARQAGTGTNAYAIWLEASPNALVDVNGICAGQGPGGAAALTGDSAGVRIVGDASGVVVRANNVFAGGATLNAVGVWADACASASPWIVNNVQISGNSPIAGARADGVRAVGDCAIRVDSNVRIVGGVESANNDANGVYCARDAVSALSSRCTVLNNGSIQGSGGGFPPRAVGVRCDDGACARIENNRTITGQSGILAYGLVLGATGTFVDGNHILAGCGRTEGDGILTIDSFARIQNNVIEGSLCAAGATSPTTAYAVHEQIGSGANEVDLHSNTLLAHGAAGACTSAALVVEPATGATPTGPWGIVRNDILHPGLCTTRYGLLEASATADPRIVENDDFWFNAAGDVLYRDEAATDITAIAGVNGLTDITVGMCISVDPMLDATNHLMTGSMCVDTGTATGAPATDFEADARPAGAGFDIGADEH